MTNFDLHLLLYAVSACCQGINAKFFTQKNIAPNGAFPAGGYCSFEFPFMKILMKPFFPCRIIQRQNEYALSQVPVLWYPAWSKNLSTRDLMETTDPFSDARSAERAESVGGEQTMGYWRRLRNDRILQSAIRIFRRLSNGIWRFPKNGNCWVPPITFCIYAKSSVKAEAARQAAGSGGE